MEAVVPIGPLELPTDYQSQFSSIVWNLKEVVFLTDAEGRWTFLNPAWEELTQFPISESLGKLFLDYVHPDDRQLNNERFRPLIERRKDHCRHEIRYLTRGGGSRYVEVHARLVFNGQGEVSGTCGTIADVSTCRSALEDLKRREAILEAVSFVAEEFLHGEDWEPAVPATIECLGRAAAVDFVALIERVQVPDSEWLVRLRHLWRSGERPDVFPTGTLPSGLGCHPVRNLAHLERILDSGGTLCGDVETFPPAERDKFRADGVQSIAVVPIFVGALRWGQLAFACYTPREWSPAIVEGLRTAAGIIGAAIRQSQSRQALRLSNEELEHRVGLRTRELAATNQALRKSEQLYRTLVETGPDAILLSDLDHRVEMVNHRAVELFGYGSASQMAGVRISDHIRNCDRHRISPFRGELARNGKVCGFELTLARLDGSTFESEISGAIVRNDCGDPTHVIRIIRDVTERTQLEEQFRQAQKMEAIGRLAGGVAHDFNNLLTVIKGYGELLLKRLNEPGHTAKVGQILKAADRAAAMVEQLLAFSRKQMIAPRVLDINASLLEMEEMLRRLIGETIELEVRLDPAAHRILIDPGHFAQLVMNLVVNARDAMPSGGSLALLTRPANQEGGAGGACVELEVRDTGIGMSEEIRSRIFEPFFTTKEVGRGTGLGLSTVYGIVQQAGGAITVDSVPGAGSAFRISLPTVAAAGAVWCADELEPSCHNGEGTILITEDEDAVRAIMAETLQECGYHVLEARNGRQALEVAAQYDGRIDLLVTDVVMPQMGGPELWAELAPLRPSLRLLYISGYTDRDLHATAAFLKKPFSSDTLIARVREILESPVQGLPVLAVKA